MPTMLPPYHPDAPKFWANESSGVLKPIIMAYLEGAALDPAQIALMRAYLCQWVMAPVWAETSSLQLLRLRCAAIKTVDDIHLAIEGCVGLGMDPL